MTDTDLSDWLTIAEAAAAIRCSTRTVERLKQAGKLEQRLRPQAGSPGVAVYSPESVAEVAAERRREAPPFVVAPIGAGNGNGHGSVLQTSTEKLLSGTELLRSGDDPIRLFFAAALRAIQSPPSPPVSETVAETLFVTIAEASTLTGLTQAYLRRAIEAGTLKAEKDRGWRIRRRDLEQL